MAAAAGSHTRILLGLAAGAVLGSLVNYLVRAYPDLKPALNTALKYIFNPVGQIFIHWLYLGIIPLVFASLALGVTRLGGSSLGSTGFRTITYFIITTACAGVIGLTLVNQIRPGDRVDETMRTELMNDYQRDTPEQNRKPAEFGINTFIDIVPKYPLKALVDSQMLAVIFTALLVGVALTRIDPAKAKVLTDILEAVNAVTEFIIRSAMMLAPAGVFCLIFVISAKFGAKFLAALVMFMLTVLAGLAIQLLVVFPILVKYLGGMSPITFFVRSRGAMITAFGTSSSSATLPTAMKTAEEELGVPARISRFVLPLSASMNHNGTALFEAVTAVFLCQVFGVDLTLGQEVTVLVLCVLTATGMAGVPGGSLPLIGMVVASVAPEIPAAAIGIVIGVDRLLDMTRTMVNVTGDLTTTVYVARSERGKDEPDVSGSLPTA